jgi:2-iminobutanoate/2-iminopropanoate deaminase
MATFPLSPYKKAGNTHYISGQIGQENGQLVSDEVGAQTLRAIENIVTILKQNGLDITDVVDVTAFITEQSDYDMFNDAYRTGFQEPFPTRTTVTVKSLPLGAKVELKAIAFK